MRLIFRPAMMLLSRLRYPMKIAVVNVVLLIPLAYITYSYVDMQRNQIAFSAKERDGVAYLGPLLDLTARTVQARQLAVSGGDAASAGVAAAIQAVDEVNGRLGTALEAERAWQEARAAVTGAITGSSFGAYNKATTALLDLIVRISDKSNLTLDPDLDSYYVMDTVVFRLPLLLDTIGRAVDRSVVSRGAAADVRDAARIELAIATGALSTTKAAVDAGIATAFKQTAREELRQKGEPIVADVRAKLNTIQSQLTTAVDRGDLAAVNPAAGQTARQAVAALSTLLVPELDQLLAARIDGLQSMAFQVVAIAAAALLLVVYLLVAFHLSATPPLRATVVTVNALAKGDLTRAVAVDSRDEVGEMGTALNSAITKLRDVVRSIDSSAGGLADYSSQLSNVSGRLRQSADSTSAQASSVNGAASEVSQNVEAVSLSTGEMTSAIGEIARSAMEATAVASEAVHVAHAADQAIRALGDSSTEIGDVVRTITTIAEQTNLLALNATIEAARAGEAGRGFGVVASEVKDLAQGTSRATEQITARIGAIQNDTRAAVAAIQEISAVISRINAIQASIAAAVEEQTATTNEMSRNISQVTGSSRDISSGIATLTEAADATTRDASSTEEAAEELAATAAGMRALVAYFRVE